MSEQRAIIYDSHHIAVHGRDISELISSSCSLSARVPLERVVSKVLITAANAIKALGNLHEDAGEHEFKHTSRAIRSCSLKAIQDGIFGREADRGSHAVKIADEVSGALELIRGQLYRNIGVISSALGGVLKMKEEELSSLLHLPLNVKKLRRIEKEINSLLFGVAAVNPSEEDVGSVDAHYHESPLDVTIKRLDGILKYLELCFLIAEVEKLELSTPASFQQFYSLTNTFNLRLYEWKRISQALQTEPDAADYTFHVNGLSFVQNLQSVCNAKFSSGFSLFPSIVERMKKLTERKHRAEFSQNAGAAQEDMAALDSEAFDVDVILGEAKNFLTRFSGPEANTQKQLVFIARDLKRHLIDPLVQLKRELRDCFDLDSAEILIDLKNELVRVALGHKALKDQHALMEGADDILSLCAFFENTCQNLLEIIDQKLSEVVIQEITQYNSKFTELLQEEQSDSNWQDRMEKFCDRLSEFRSHRLESSLSEALKKRVYNECGRMYWTGLFTIVEAYEDPETLGEIVDLLAENQQLFQRYTSELKEIGEIDQALDVRIRSYHFRRVESLSDLLLRLLHVNTLIFGQRALEYAEEKVSFQLAHQIARTSKEFKVYCKEVNSILKSVETGKEALILELKDIESIFSVMLIEYSLRTYSEDPENSIDKFLAKQKRFQELQAEVLAERSSSEYHGKLREKLLGVEAFIRSEVESYVGTFTGAIIGLLDEIEGCSVYSQPERTALFEAFHKRIELLERKCINFISVSAFPSENFTHVRLGIENLKMRFQQDSLRGMRSHLNSLVESMMKELATSPEKAEFYRKQVEAFYSEVVVPNLFGEEAYSPEAIYLFKEEDVILSKIRTISEGGIASSPEIRDLTTPVGRVGSADLLAAHETPTSEAVGLALSPSPTRPVSSFPV
jgi:hypothetical protein